MRKIAEITQGTGIVWRHCPTDKNLADLGSRGASIDKMQTRQWLRKTKKNGSYNQSWRGRRVKEKSTKRKNKRCCTLKKKNLTSGTHFWTEARLKEISATLQGLYDSFTTHSSRDVTLKRGLVRLPQRR